MNNTTTTARAKTRTWKTTLVDVEYGVTRSITTRFVTLKRDHDGSLSAIVDGENVAFVEAVRILTEATRTELLEEVILTPTIGKQKARALHVEMGVLGYRSGHYQLASDALGVDVRSLAALTPEDAVIVRSYIYGQLGMVAA